MVALIPVDEREDYPVIDVTDWPIHQDESVGSKRKMWLFEPRHERRWLFKHLTAPGVGEDWAEKTAAELAGRLALPHAIVELARWRSNPGLISLDFTRRRVRGELVLGRRLLSDQDDSYPATRTFRNVEHTAQRIKSVLQQAFVGAPADVPAFVKGAADLFVGYLMLDALIGNTDRHHENWGILPSSRSGVGVAVLAPTFDHASSLGRELTDSERERRLDTRDAGYSVRHYAIEKARSAIYDEARPTRPLSPIRLLGALLATLVVRGPDGSIACDESSRSRSTLLWGESRPRESARSPRPSLVACSTRPTGP